MIHSGVNSESSVALYNISIIFLELGTGANNVILTVVCIGLILKQPFFALFVGMSSSNVH